MEILVRELKAGDEESVTNIDGSFIADSTLILHLKGDKIGYTVKERPCRIKSYDDEQSEEDTVEDYSNYISNPHQTMYLAFVDKVRKLWFYHRRVRFPRL